MRVAKFNVPVFMLTKFLDFINKQGLKSTIVSKKEEIYQIEIPFMIGQAPIIGEMEELVEVLAILVLGSVTALSRLVTMTESIQSKKSGNQKQTIKKVVFSKILLSKM